TEDGGRNWRKLDAFPGVPEMTYVARLLASQHDANTVYAAFENHKNMDFAPYLLKSMDAGRTWASIAGDLPKNGPVLAIAEDHVNPNLLFAGTEFGLFFTVNGGQRWVQLKGNLPTIAVRDLAIQKREHDLVVATFGRGIYVLDNYAPLRVLKPETLALEASLFPVKDALMYIQAQPLGGRGKSFQGESFYTAENPPFGATFTYYLKESLKTRKARRQEADAETEKKKLPPSIPRAEDLRAEEEEEAPAIILTVTDASGQVVRRLTGPSTAGMQRITWDLRSPASTLAPPPSPDGDDAFGEPPSGPLVLPGAYKVSLAKRVGGVTTALAGPQEFTVAVEGQTAMTPTDRATLVAFQQRVARLQRAVIGALDTANSLRPRLIQIRRALIEAPAADERLLNQAAALEKRLNALLLVLRGDNVLRARNYNTPPSLSERVFGIVGDQRMSTSRPTQTQSEQYRIAAEDFAQAQVQLRQLVETDLKKLERELEATGAPWTSGRLPEWKEN
ncbi:MAG: glycosyl hydrolase, partial [Pyrinomonadaceae bacterium]